jgi:predicted acetyltransferase
MTMKLISPSLGHLPGYLAALEQGWSSDNIRGAEAAKEQVAKITENAAAFVDGLEDIDAKGEPLTLPDGSTIPRLPGYHRWMWDGEFCGTIGFRWQPGTSALPAHVLGHVGYAVVPWKRGRGYARQAVKLLLPEIRERGLAHIEVTTDRDNIASQRVIVSCGGELVERFRKPEAFGGTEALRYRINLMGPPASQIS